MKAIVQDRYGSSDVLELRDIDRPALGDDDVLVRVHAAGMDAGVWHLMTGLPKLVRIIGYGFRSPKIPIRGTDLAGTVEAVGANVTSFQTGDAVYGRCEGSFAEYACAPADDLVLKPTNLTFEEAAAVPTSAVTALQALRAAGGLRRGEKVLILGAAGGVGSFAVQLARSFGAHVTGVCSTTKVDLVRALGADHVIDYTQSNFTDGSTRYDVILDLAGNRPLSQLRRALEPTGTLVIVGGESGGRWLGGIQRNLWAILLSPLHRQTLKGLMAKVNDADLKILKEMIEAGEVNPVIDRVFTLEEAPKAVRYWEEGHVRGKVAITI